MDQPWDSSLIQFIPLIRQASTSLKFQITFLQLVTKINDSHGFTSSSTLTNLFWGGSYMPMICFTRIDSQCVVRKVQNITGVTPGDVLVKLKGIPIQQIEDSLVAYIPASTPAALYRDMYQDMLQGGYGSVLEMTLLDSNNTEYTVSTQRYSSVGTWYNWKLNPGSTSPYYITTCDYGYVNMGYLQSSQVPAMYNALKDAPAIIFDIRNYPNGTLWDLGPLLFTSPVTSAIYYDPALTYLQTQYYYLPGWYYVSNDHYNLGQWYNPNAYAGKVYILVNEETQSQAEYTCQYFSLHPDSRVFGTQSAGADGNVSYLSLPGGIISYFTSLGWYYADGYQQQRNGVKIDTVVTPTRAGFRHGNDEILDAALDCLTGMAALNQTPETLSAYPNPVYGQVVHLALILEQNAEVRISIYSMAGEPVLAQSATGRQGNNEFSFNLNRLNPGLYLIKAETEKHIITTKIIIN